MIRIVFVDDEPSVLRGLQPSLHHMGSEWSMAFVESGHHALGELAATRADVIVSYMCMPVMSGWDLLNRVRHLYPGVVRLMLSEQAQASSVIRAMGGAHQYLAKPCDSETLKAAIARSQALRGLLSDARVADLVGRVGLLPSALALFQELVECVRDPSASIADAAEGRRGISGGYASRCWEASVRDAPRRSNESTNDLP